MSEKTLAAEYKKTVNISFVRLIISRTFSLLYIFLVARFIPQSIQDSMIVLAVGQLIIISVLMLGLRFSLPKLALSSKDPTSYIDSSVIYFGAASLMAGIISFGYYGAVFNSFFIISLNSLLFACSTVLGFLLESVLILDTCFLNVHKVPLIRLIYSTANSLSVPIFFFLSPKLTSILLAWIFSFLLSFIPELRVLSKVLRSRKWNVSRLVYTIKYGLPVYLGTIITLLFTSFDKWVVFLLSNSPQGAVASYYWSQKISIIFIELIATIFTGAFPIFTTIQAKKTRDIKDVLAASYKTIFLVATMIIGLAYITSPFIIFILLGPNFMNSVILLRLFLIFSFFNSISGFLSNYKMSTGDRRDLLFYFVIRTLIYYGSLGLILTFQEIMIKNDIIVILTSLYIFAEFCGFIFLYTKSKIINIITAKIQIKLLVVAIIPLILDQMLPLNPTILILFDPTWFLQVLIRTFITVLFLTVTIHYLFLFNEKDYEIFYRVIPKKVLPIIKIVLNISG